MNYINHSIKRSHIPSPSSSDDRASERTKMEGARINDCCEDRDGRCKN